MAEYDFDWQIFWMWMNMMEDYKKKELEVLQDIQNKITDMWKETCQK